MDGNPGLVRGRARPVICIVAALCVAGAAVLLLDRQIEYEWRESEPMFWNAYGEGNLGGRGFRPNAVAEDGMGNYAFADVTLNLYVVVATGSEAPKGDCVPKASHEVAVLFPDAPFARRIDHTENALIVVLPDGRAREFPLGAGIAREWYPYFVMRCNEVGVNLLSEVADRYSGQRASELRRFVESGTSTGEASE